MINLIKMLELTIDSKKDYTKLLQLEDMLKQYILEQTAKSKGGNKEIQRLKAARKYLKESSKMNINPIYSTYWMVNGKQYMSNTHSGIELVSIIEGLDQIPEDAETPKLFDIIESVNKDANIEIKVTSIIELKAQYKSAIAIAKAKKTETVNIKEGLMKINKSIINLKLFLDIIDMFPNDKLEYYAGKEKLSPILIKDDLGNRAIILAIRTQSEESYENVVRFG